MSIDLLDLVRIMSVLLNNAVEGAAESSSKQMEVAVIKMDLETVIVIQNSCKITMTPSEDLFELGFSLKVEIEELALIMSKRFWISMKISFRDRDGR